jgi:hypothetical protein
LSIFLSISIEAAPLEAAFKRNRVVSQRRSFFALLRASPSEY